MRIASISKSFTATGLMQQVEKGVISLDDEINDLIGFTIRNPHHPDVPITLRMVLSHTASFRDKEDYSTLDYNLFTECSKVFCTVFVYTQINKLNKLTNLNYSLSMKTKIKHLLWIVAICCCSATNASDYVLLSPLDTVALPDIPTKDQGGDMVRSALKGDAVWQSTQKQLARDHFSDESVYQVMKKLYRFTHKHYVSFPVAYWSSDPHGDSLLVSGRVYLPKHRYLSGIVIASHYTICSDAEAPSNMIAMESVLTMKGYAVIMPDYVGYGLSRDEVHPYLHWRSAAQTAVDLLNCMPALLAYYGYSYPTDIVIDGYSQGGAVALGIARMIEENYNANGLSDEKPGIDWTIRKLYAGAGPYDPAATYDYCVNLDTMGIPAAIPMIVMGLSEAYDLGFELKDFFNDPLLSNYDEWVGSKTHTVGEINHLMGSTVMTQLMPAKALDREQPLAELLYEALSWNSNVGYDLQAPAYFLHSVEDEVVPIVNSLRLAAEMPDDSNVTYDFGKYGSHMAASIPFMQYLYQDL